MPVYVITGTSRGLGLEWVRQLSQIPQNTIYATIRDASKAPAPLEEIKASSKAPIHILSLEATKSESIRLFSDALNASLGSTGKIDYLINNAAVCNTRENTFAFDTANLAEHIAINVSGPANLTNALLPHLGQGSAVINITTGMGSKGEWSAGWYGPVASCSAYSISKAALNMLTLHQSLDLKERGITVVSLCPGWVKSDLGGWNAPLEAKDSVAGMIKVL
ncbi:NAD(P)-binding protein, partial [Clavulina sp. PMI_390]